MFQYEYHIPASSWTKDKEEWEEEEKDGFFYDYIIVGKDTYAGNIERIIFSSTNKKHAYETLTGCIDGTGIYYYKSMKDYRLIRIPMYKYVGVNYNHKRYHRQEINILHDSVLLYCPVTDNKIHRVYGTYSSKCKKNGGRYWTAPRTIKGVRHG